MGRVIRDSPPPFFKNVVAAKIIKICKTKNSGIKLNIFTIYAAGSKLRNHTFITSENP
jgi:hypothetical protein